MKLSFYLATKNKNKLREIRFLLQNTGIEVLPCPAEIVFPDEDGTSFEENALIKARYLRQAAGVEYAVGEDSGLLVAKLGGSPGIFSARFAGIDADDRDNIKKLLSKLSPYHKKADREAKFVAAVAFAGPFGEKVFTGEIKGFITESPRGKGGFGYDPVFEVAGTERTFAEMSEEEKIKISHRSRAFMKLADYLLKV